MSNGLLKIYTTTSCGDCRMAKAVLDRAGVDYDEINLDRTPDAVATVLEMPNTIPPTDSVAEALHSTGLQTMIATAVGFEMYELGAGESIGPAMASKRGTLRGSWSRRWSSWLPSCPRRAAG